MIVNHKHKFIFVKTRKTAGTSIECALSEHCDGGDMITTISAEDEKLRTRGPQNNEGFENHSNVQLALKKWPDYYTFCVERNPFDKHISAYYWHHQGEEGLGVNKWMPNMRQRSNWGIYAIGNNIAVDFVGRYCHLQEDLATFCDTVGLPALELPKAKSRFRQNHEHYSKVINEFTRGRIKSVCRREIAALDWCRWREEDE